MTNEPLCADLIERYLRARGSRYFHGQHDGDFFYVANTRPRRLHVHLETCPAHDDVLVVRVVPACWFPATDRPWLNRFADSWNRQDREVTAIVHNSCDPRRIGVTARRSRWIRDGNAVDDFSRFLDKTIADAIELFAELAQGVDWQPAQPLLRVAG